MGALALAGLALGCAWTTDDPAAEPEADDRGPAAAAEPVGDPRLERWRATAIRSQSVEVGG
jgi:hypothetical protein